jgi:long-chain acyl-CoA synthetase
MTLSGLLDSACARFGAATALRDAGGALTYADLDRQAATIAAALRAAGVGNDEPVVVMVSNRASDFAAFLGAWRTGAVAVPVHRSSPPAVVAAFVARTGARCAVEPTAVPIAPGFVADGVLQRADQPPPLQRPLLAGAALIIFTSGSTGEPKGVVLSHAAFSRKLAAIDSLLAFPEGGHTLLVLNITFSFGLWVSLLTLARGGTLHIEPRFTPEGFATALATQPIERVGVVPTMMRAYLAAFPEDGVTGAARAPALRRILIGGEALGGPLSARIRRAFPDAGLTDIFGLTETATSDFFLMPDEHDAHPGCIGRPSPGVAFRITDAGGRPAPAGTAGELQIRTPCIMNGYLDAPDLTARAFDGEWFRTGDLARVTPAGMVELVGRAKEIVSRSGMKIAPLEVEHALAAHPDVAAALATGLPDPVTGERLCALVVPRAGATPTAQALRAFLGTRIERYKIPDAFHVGDALPLGRTGKADRGALRLALEAGAFAALA